MARNQSMVIKERGTMDVKSDGALQRVIIGSFWILGGSIIVYVGGLLFWLITSKMAGAREKR